MIRKFDDFFEFFMAMPLLLKLFVILTLIVLPVPLGYVLSPEIYTNTQIASPFIKTFPLINNLLLVIHVSCAIPAILFGPFLLYRPLVRNKPRIHRLLGKFYIFGCMIAAITIFPVALFNIPSKIGPIGFSIMAIFWFLTTFFAYNAARRKNYVAHRRWVIRSYAMTLAFIHVNFTYRLLMPYDHITYDTLRAFQSLVSWQFNLLIAEFYLAATNFNGTFVGKSQWFKNLTHLSHLDKMYLTKAKLTKPA